MKKKLMILCLFIITIITVFGVLGCNEVQQNNEIKQSIKATRDNLIYTYVNQQNMLEKLNAIKAKEEYTFDKPLIITNPFGSNTVGLYIYFKSEVPSMMKYTVHVKDKNIKDFTRVLYNEESNNLTTEHEYSLIGLVGGMKNKVSLALYNENNKIIDTNNFTITMPELSEESDKFLIKEEGDSKESLSEGLFVTLGHIKLKDPKIYKSYFYDNDGVARGELNLDGYRVDKLIFKDDLLYISTNINQICGINRLGFPEKIYDLGKYELHHDYILGKNNSMIILANDTESDSVEDIILQLNLEDGEVKELLNLGELFGDYKEKTLVDAEKGKRDWIHINSICSVNDNDILISSRETSSLIKINNIYSNPYIDYIIGHKNFWEGTSYSDYLLTQIGEFSVNSGQHDARVIYSDLLKNNQYYIDLFNNNLGYSASNPFYNWNEIKNINNDKSMYYRYLVDESNRTFELVDELIVDRSDYISNLQHYDNHIIVDSGNARSFAEYGNDDKLIAKFKIEQDIWGLYRCYKESFNDFYFYNKAEK